MFVIVITISPKRRARRTSPSPKTDRKRTDRNISAKEYALEHGVSILYGRSPKVHSLICPDPGALNPCMCTLPENSVGFTMV